MALVYPFRPVWHRCTMSEEEPTTRELRIVQGHRADDEAQRAQEAQPEAESRAHARRAEKAAYLRDRLAEAEAAEREGRDDDAG
jgi:hypothetical protein